MTSPLPVVLNYEKEVGCQPFQIALLLAGETFAKLEVNAISFNEFVVKMNLEAKEQGIDKFNMTELMRRLENSFQVRSEMVWVIHRLRKLGYCTAAVTNNWYLPQNWNGGRDRHGDTIKLLKDCFDVIVESRRVGLRKPDPAIYKLAMQLLKVNGFYLCVTHHQSG